MADLQGTNHARFDAVRTALQCEIRHLLSHTSGVPGLEQPAAVEDLFDWNTSTARMAAQAPWWAPGTASGYHLLNFGHLIGEVVRRVSGKPLKQFVAEEIAGGGEVSPGSPTRTSASGADGADQ